MTTLASQMVTVGVGLGGAAAISLVVSVVTARLLGVEQFGLYGFAFAYVALWGVFMDAGAVYAHGQRLRDATFHQGVGGGVFLLATLFQLNLDVAYGIDNKVRVHFTTGFQF